MTTTSVSLTMASLRGCQLVSIESRYQVLPGHKTHPASQMTMCGTLEYMAPEVMDCKFASTGSDMWGVGSIAYLLLSGGKSPFWGGNR